MEAATPLIQVWYALSTTPRRIFLNDILQLHFYHGYEPWTEIMFATEIKVWVGPGNWYDRRKFRSQTSDNMDRWKAEQGRGREKRKIRRKKSRREKSKKKEDADARKR